ncbi:MAG: phosphonate ABC transporter, permease protein PhnE [Verrucomicrobia bacterium]|nr:phosphonate ABC transporter, permease protein PhnE [Verrucomicrobiota bacterium]
MPTRQTSPPQPPTLPPMAWYERLTVLNVTFLIFLCAALVSLRGIHGSGRELNLWGNLSRKLHDFFPPDLSVLGKTLGALGETFEIAVVATLLASVVSLPLALAAARTVSPGWLVAVARMVLNAIRTIPSLIWALLAVAVVGPNPLAGVIGLMFYSIGYLGKFFADAFESVDLEVPRGLRAIGAHPIQAFQFGLWPHARPLVGSYTLWMLEYNLRSASIIGYVGAGGIGVQLHIYQEYGQWDRFCTVLLVILAIVTLLDFFGDWLRRRIAPR